MTDEQDSEHRSSYEHARPFQGSTRERLEVNCRQAELTAKLDIKEDNRLALAWLGDRNLVRRHPESGLSDFEDALLTWYLV